MKTIQIRRYQLGEGQREVFLDWWLGQVVPIRRRLGYQVEFAYHLPESNEIVWAASVAGDRSEWNRVEAEYEASADRVEAFSKLPSGVILSKDLRFVDDLSSVVDSV